MSRVQPWGRLLGTVVLLSPVAVAARAGTEPPRAPAETATPAITVFTYDADTTRERAAQVENAAGTELTQDSRFRFQPFSSLFDPVEDTAALLAEADKQVQQADKLFGEMDLEKGKQLLLSSIATYREHLPQLAERSGGILPMHDAYVKLAKTCFFDGDADGARDALRYVFVLDKNTLYNPKTFPPQMKKTVIEARLLFSTLGSGKLQITSEPPGADVWLNGAKLPKPTPCETEAPAGPNFVTLRLRGHVSAHVVAEVKGEGETSTLSQALTRPAGDPLAALDKVRLQLGEPRLLQLRDAAKALGRDMILLYRFRRHDQPDGSVRDELLAYLYDARPDRVINQRERAVLERDLSQAASDMTREVTTGVRLDGVWSPPPKVKRPSLFFSTLITKMTDFYRWKGFWYVVGGAAAVLVVGTAVGIGVAAQRHTAEQVVLLGGN